MSAEVDGTEPDDDELSDLELQRERFAERLREVGVSTQRFIDVHDGAKGTRNHTQRGPDAGKLSGNYGVYGGPGGDSDIVTDPHAFEGDPEEIEDLWLVDVDVDDYENSGDEPTAGLESLPETFTIESPHTDGTTGGHRYYAVRGHAATALNDAIGAKNPSPPWGEVRVYNQMCVGPGSQIQPGGCDVSWCDECRGCDKEWCDECAKPEGGYYRIATDREIAVLDLEEFVEAVVRDLDADTENNGASEATTRGVVAEAQTVAGGAGADDAGGGNDSGDVPPYEPNPDISAEDVLRQNPEIALYISGVEKDDRSSWDWRACKEFAKLGVSEAEAREVLDQSGNTKVAERGDDYWTRTWGDALDSIIEECNDDDRPVPWENWGDGSEDDVPEPTTVMTADDVGIDRFADVRAEPLINDGKLGTAVVSEDGHEVTSYPFGIYECAVCGTYAGTQLKRDESPRPPTECPQCGDEESWTQATPGDVRSDIHPDPPWYPPETVDPDCMDELWDDTHEYIREHWDAGDDDHLYHGLTAFVLTTWLRSDLKFLPHIMVIGRWTGGKTRLLNTLARVSYRAGVYADVTPASIYRLIDGHDATCFISEYHGLNQDARQQLDAVVRAAQKRGERIPRCVGDNVENKNMNDVAVYDPFTHVGIATQFEPEDDIISRCIQIRTSRPSEDRNIPAEIDDATGVDIRNRMLAARYCYLETDDLARAERLAYGYLEQRGIKNRLREKLLSLITVAELWEKTDELEPFIDELIRTTKEAEQNSVDALFIEAVRDLAFEEIGTTTWISEDIDPFATIEIPLSDVTERFNDMTGQDRSASWAGHVRSRHGLNRERKTDGTVIRDDDLGDKLQTLCNDFGLEWERLDSHETVTEIAKHDRYKANCSECGKREWITHRHVTEGHHMCTGCAKEWEES